MLVVFCLLFFITDGADTNFRGRLFHRAHGQEKETTSFVLQKVFCASIVATKFNLPAEMYSSTHSSTRLYERVAILIYFIFNLLLQLQVKDHCMSFSDRR